MAPGQIAVGFASNFLFQPVILQAPAPDPNDTRIQAIDQVVNGALSLALGFAPRFETTLVADAVLAQSGSGVSAGTSLHVHALPVAALRDPRVSIGFDAVSATSDHSSFNVKLINQLSLPLGNQSAFAGDRSLVAAPSVSIVQTWGRWMISNQFGFRFRAPVRLADTTMGSQLFEAAGISFEAIPANRLEFGLEAWMLPVLVSQKSTQADGSRVDSTLVPAEWMLSTRTSLGVDHDWIAQLGFGTAIQLSEQTRSSLLGSTSHETFSAATSASFRASFVLRYVTDIF